MLTTILNFLNNRFIPLLYVLAFLFFLINVFRYFIIGSGNEESREKAKQLAIWGILAFVLLFGIWGFVNILIGVFGVGDSPVQVPDYMCEKFWGDCGTI